MTRLLAAVALLALPAAASAQVRTLVPVGPPILGGRAVSGPAIGDFGSALYPVQTAVPSRFSVGGGALSGYPQLWLPSGSWGGANYAWPVQPVIETVTVPAPARTTRVRPGVATPQITQAGQTEATLVLQFPAAAEVWVGGKKRDGDPAAEWTLTSPALEAGVSHTFEVKGRWKTGGKTFEASRSVLVIAGDRNRWVVVSGTEVKE